MPWKELCAMDQRVRFIGDWLTRGYSKKELCREYGVSRPTGDKWIERYGVEGLGERSRRPHVHPNRTGEEVVERIVAMKLRHPSFRPKKVMDRLRAVEPQRRWPVDSTAGEILRQKGLVRPRRLRRRVAPHPQAFVESRGPGESWSADFKGDFRLGALQDCVWVLTFPSHAMRSASLLFRSCRPRFGVADAPPLVIPAKAGIHPSDPTLGRPAPLCTG